MCPALLKAGRCLGISYLVIGPSSQSCVCAPVCVRVGLICTLHCGGMGRRRDGGSCLAVEELRLGTPAALDLEAHLVEQCHLVLLIIQAAEVSQYVPRVCWGGEKRADAGRGGPEGPRLSIWRHINSNSH